MRRLLYPLYRRLETSVHPLRYLFVEITQRCNLRCRHCGSDCSSAPRHDELSAEEWLAFFDYLGASFDARRLVLAVTGGEPLCARELDRLLAGLKRNGLLWGMVSNGYALDAATLARLRAHNLISLTVSLDGLAASHDWLRGVEGSHARAVRAIALAAASRLPFFDVVTCVHPRNLDELPAIEAQLRQLGVRAWRLFSIFPKGRAAQNRELLLDDDQLRELLGWIAARRQDRGADPLQLQFSCEGYLPTALDREVRTEPYFCRAGISIGSVLCDGAISACPNISRDLIQGNIRQDDFAEVWEQRFERYRDRSWMQQGLCQGCAEWERCLGNSMHLWDPERGETGRCFFAAL
jgi:radical SAM protein with 4Fe4S-binding SPASM domain